MFKELVSWPVTLSIQISVFRRRIILLYIYIYIIHWLCCTPAQVYRNYIWHGKYAYLPAFCQPCSRNTGYLPFYFQGYRILSILLPGVWDATFNLRDTAFSLQNIQIQRASGIYRQILENTGKYDLQPSIFGLVISMIEVFDLFFHFY